MKSTHNVLWACAKSTAITLALIVGTVALIAAGHV
jgi:hypothetical protein